MSTAQADPIAAMAEAQGGWEPLARHLYSLVYDNATNKPAAIDAFPTKRCMGRPRKHELQFWLAAKDAITRLVDSRRCHNQEVAAEEIIRLLQYRAETKTAEANGAQLSYAQEHEINHSGIAELLDDMLDQDPIGLRIGENGEAVWDAIEYRPSVSLTKNAKSFINRMNEHTARPDWL